MTPSKTAKNPMMMEITTSALAVRKSWGNVSTELWTLHFIWPVHWTTQYIHKPSKMNSAVMLLEPMKAVTFHEGRAQVVMVPRKPMIAKVKPRRCLQSALMVKFCKSLQGGKCLLESCHNLYLTKLLLSNLEGKWKVHSSHTSHIFWNSVAEVPMNVSYLKVVLLSLSWSLCKCPRDLWIFQVG